jgi:hypothetical protein
VASDLPLAEFNALRGEVLAIRQIQTAVYTAALTILAAIGGFALEKRGSRVEILLVLPFVLSGLGVILVESNVGIENIGAFIRTELPKRLPVGEAESWEQFIERKRGKDSKLYRGLSMTSPALILVVPSIASFGINGSQATGRLWPLFWAGAIAVAAFLGLLLATGPGRGARDLLSRISRRARGHKL